MTLMTSAIFPELDVADCLEDRTVTHTLSYTGSAWVLLTHHGRHARPTWSTPLDQHGAGRHAAPGAAQAVAARVLRELAVEVTGWTPGPDRLDGAAPDLVAATVPAPGSRLRGLRGH